MRLRMIIDVPDSVTFTTMIAACGKEHLAERAVNFWQEMTQVRTAAFTYLWRSPTLCYAIDGGISN